MRRIILVLFIIDDDGVDVVAFVVDDDVAVDVADVDAGNVKSTVAVFEVVSVA